MDPWVWWIIAAAVLLGVELATGTLVLAMLAAGALAGAGAAALGGDVWVQVLAFAGVGALMLAVVRPVARRHLQQPLALRTGAAALVGEYAVVLAATDGEDGRVRIGSDVWSARAYDPDATFDPGERVQVLKIEGATALIG